MQGQEHQVQEGPHTCPPVSSISRKPSFQAYFSTTVCTPVLRICAPHPCPPSLQHPLKVSPHRLARLSQHASTDSGAGAPSAGAPTCPPQSPASPESHCSKRSKRSRRAAVCMRGSVHACFCLNFPVCHSKSASAVSQFKFDSWGRLGKFCWGPVGGDFGCSVAQRQHVGVKSKPQYRNAAACWCEVKASVSQCSSMLVLKAKPPDC
eukprot:1161070-Pelagomonas_calceolata.AAC.6